MRVEGKTRVRRGRKAYVSKKEPSGRKKYDTFLFRAVIRETTCTAMVLEKMFGSSRAETRAMRHCRKKKKYG